jgi:hypothetical protein
MLGIILREYMDEHRPDMNIQIFATTWMRMPSSVPGRAYTPVTLPQT